MAIVIFRKRALVTFSKIVAHLSLQGGDIKTLKPSGLAADDSLFAE
jgi:hypothetical protein